MARDLQMAKLIFMGEKFPGRVYEFAIEKTTVGRGDHNTLTIHDASISHSHCEILVYGTEVIVRDLGSRNGTLVNGERVEAQQQRPLADGQMVRFGAVEARLELASIPDDSDTVTGLTAFHAYERLVRVPEEVKPAAPVSATPEEPSCSPRDDHTLILSRPPQAENPGSLSQPPASTVPKKSPGKARLVFIAAVIGLALAILFWLMLANAQ
jgi:predicted component of type VI protein secretion system